ncbi:MAG TPA: PilZ domain-containing protein, partial [Candidatus Binatia bacterium]|nr:PilZ domain-containing protein [Candidatus Binatia bacterium]
MRHPICPQCGKAYVKRVSRCGLKERLLSAFYVYPFRCQLCGHRFGFLQWGVRYVRVAEDQRNYERLPAKFSVTLTGGHIEAAGTAIDISMSGCTLHADARLAQDAIVQMKLQLPQDALPVTVNAAVVRNVVRNRVGVEFLRIDKADRE